jgi:hypothetical protein
VSRAPAALVFLLYAAVLCGFTQLESDSANVHSRLLTIKALVERGTFRFDDGPFVPVDHIIVGDGFYSDKPPVLQVLGAGVYVLLHRLGYELYVGEIGEPYGQRDAGHQVAVLVLTLVLVQLAAAAVAASFVRVVWTLPGSDVDRLGLWLGLAFGTLFFTYAVTLTNHVPGGAMLWCAFALVFLRGSRGIEPRRGAIGSGGTPWTDEAERLPWAVWLASGLAAGFAVVIDPPAGGVFLPLFAFEAWHRGGARAAVCLMLAAAVPLAGHGVAQWSATGFLLPPASYYPRYFPEALQLEAGPSDLASRLRYTGTMLFGASGVFRTTPTLLFGVLGMIASLRRGAAVERRAALGVLGATMVLVAYYGFGAPANLGGRAYGFRWFVAPTPILYWYACESYARSTSRVVRGAFWLCAAASIIAATSGARNPWSRGDGNWSLLTSGIF